MLSFLCFPFCVREVITSFVTASYDKQKFNKPRQISQGLHNQLRLLVVIAVSTKRSNPCLPSAMPRESRIHFSRSLIRKRYTPAASRWATACFSSASALLMHWLERSRAASSSCWSSFSEQSARCSIEGNWPMLLSSPRHEELGRKVEFWRLENGQETTRFLHDVSDPLPDRSEPGLLPNDPMVGL
jgi:hypothetical protein